MNLENLNLVALSSAQELLVNGGELPYNANEMRGRDAYAVISNVAHQVGDFLRGFTSAF